MWVLLLFVIPKSVIHPHDWQSKVIAWPLTVAAQTPTSHNKKQILLAALFLPFFISSSLSRFFSLCFAFQGSWDYRRSSPRAQHRAPRRARSEWRSPRPHLGRASTPGPHGRARRWESTYTCLSKKNKKQRKHAHTTLEDTLTNTSRC